jgi:hypothetical protein
MRKTRDGGREPPSQEMKRGKGGKPSLFTTTTPDMRKEKSRKHARFSLHTLSEESKIFHILAIIITYHVLP